MDPYNQNQQLPPAPEQPGSGQLPTPDVDRLISVTPQTQIFGKRKRSKKPLAVIVILLLLLGGGAAATYYFMPGLFSPAPVVTKQPPKKSNIDVSDPLKTSSAYFAAIAKCDLKTTRLLNSDEKIRTKPDDFSQNQLTDCTTNVAPLYASGDYKFFSLKKATTDGSVTAIFRSKSLPANGDALITMKKSGSSWYVTAFTPQSAPIDAATPATSDSELTTRVDKLAAALEQYYTDHFSYYPTSDNLADDAWISTNMPTLDTATLFYDGAKTQRINSGASYTYSADNCDDSGSGCAYFTITITLPSGSSYTKKSVNTAG